MAVEQATLIAIGAIINTVVFFFGVAVGIASVKKGD